MEFKYTLVLRSGAKVIAEPAPTGWETLTIALKRDQESHGMFLDYGLEPLNFTGEPADLITEEYDEYGVAGQVSLIVDSRCSDGQYDRIYFGKLNFNAYESICGIECGVSIEAEDAQDIMLFRNNYAQKVNINSNIAFDQTTVLADYDALNIDLTIPGRGLPLRVAGNSETGPALFNPISVLWPGINNAVYIRPNYSQNQLTEIETNDLAGGDGYSINQVIPPHPNILEPQLRVEVQEDCSSGVYNYRFRLRGHIYETYTVPHTAIVQAVVIKGDSYPNGFAPALHKVTLATGSFPGNGGPDIDFDETFSGSIALADGEALRAFLFVGSTPNSSLRTQTIGVDWHSDTLVDISTISQCDPTVSKVNLINETISRCAEAITNDAIRFYSTYFGRTNSQPYAISFNACAGMLAVTNGLNVRRKLLVDSTQPGFFQSMQDIFQYLRRVFNIGFTVEPDPQRPGFKRLRFEDWRYFYQNDFGGLMFRPTSVRKRVDPNRVFNRVILGYTKWEAERFSGLDEFMTTREYRTGVDSADNPQDIQTDLITSPYTTEITRRQAGGTQDWKYDNDTFAFALANSLPYQVEQFETNTSGVENVSDPGSCYNGRLRPATIAMRWFDYVIQGIKTVTAATQLIFTKGTGNYIAKLKTNTCNIEGVPIRENENIDITDFNNVSEAQPIQQPEFDTFDSPMSYNTFLRLLNEPELRFKSIKYFCGEKLFEGWINNVQYTLGVEGGMAEIEVIPKNLLQIPAPEPPCSAMVSDVEVTVLDEATGLIEVDFTESAPGADNWSWEITIGAVTDTGNVNTHPFQVSGYGPGDYTITIIPRCGTNVGSNIGLGAFTITGSEMLIELTAINMGQGVPGAQDRIRLIATKVGGGAFTNGFSFKFGMCTSGSYGSVCSGFPSAPGGSAGARTITGVVGNTSAQAIFTVPDDSTLDIVTAFDLVTITSAQISEAPGELWNLNFE